MVEPNSNLKQGDVAFKDDRIARNLSSIRVNPDFPSLDITTMLLDPVAFKDTIDLFVERYKEKNISVVAAFISAPISLYLSQLNFKHLETKSPSIRNQQPIFGICLSKADLVSPETFEIWATGIKRFASGSRVFVDESFFT
ncbi:hypothetical protein L2E82_31143 [Cichorium intybus]|uniref:Uncharacterized protein n=1 Tax=Cichorium intybus TaxID=13427 RepID=A0ACB9D2Q4_CICIN|nr:hypothetical protein L2E82_31143 [Cichorium intybus]